MDFDPRNNIVKRCLQGMAAEENGKAEDAINIFLQAFDEAENDFEKYLAAYYVALLQTDAADKLKWLQSTLQFALNINSVAVTSAFPALYLNMAKCYEELNEADNAKKYMELSDSLAHHPTDKGPFYHGTKVDLQIGDLLTPGIQSNYKADLIMNHIYFTALPNGAGLAAALAAGEGPERVYMVETTGEFENDPNVTDKKFPGNPTRSYRSASPLKIVGELKDWARQSSEDIQAWRKKLANLNNNSGGEIIN